MPKKSRTYNRITLIRSSDTTQSLWYMVDYNGSAVCNPIGELVPILADYRRTNGRNRVAIQDAMINPSMKVITNGWESLLEGT